MFLIDKLEFNFCLRSFYIMGVLGGCLTMIVGDCFLTVYASCSFDLMFCKINVWWFISYFSSFEGELSSVSIANSDENIYSLYFKA